MKASRNFCKYALKQSKGKKTCPFKIEQHLEKNFEVEREDMTSNKQGLLVKVKNQAAFREILKLTKIDDIPCSKSPHKSYNSSKGLIYVAQYDIQDEESFKGGLKEKYDIAEVYAKWIRCRNIGAKPYLVTFNGSLLPECISIPREQKDLRVYQYYPKPLFCKNCLLYTHTQKNCRNPVRCANCS